MKKPTRSRRVELDTLVELGRRAARPPTSSELQAGLAAVRERLSTGRTWRRRFQRFSVVLLFVVPSMVWLHRGRWFDDAPLAPSYEVRGGTVLEGGYLRESDDAGVDVGFGEGSRFKLSPGSRGRLRAVTSDRVHIAIERGVALMDVTPGTGRQWEVDVGPFVVVVRGTSFAVSWEPTDERFELRLRQGRVVVTGPVSGGALELQAGQRLAVDLSRATMLITEDGAWDDGDDTVSPSSAGATVSAPGTELGAASTGEAPAATTRGDELHVPGQPAATLRKADDGAPKARPEPRRRWSEALANGRWDEILADVDRDGLTTTLGTASSEELFALASAARYRRRLGVAHDTLQALRRRFAGSPRAVEAVFLLGRVQEARAADWQRAIAWYDEYLALAPSGAYAAEALGRKLTIVSKVFGKARARAIAEDYLRRFPEGSHAGSARALLDDD